MPFFQSAGFDVLFKYRVARLKTTHNFVISFNDCLQQDGTASPSLPLFQASPLESFIFEGKSPFLPVASGNSFGKTTLYVICNPKIRHRICLIKFKLDILGF